MYACKQVGVSCIADQSADVTSIAVAVPLTAVLCSLLSSCMTALAMYCYFMSRKKRGSRGVEKQGPAEREPVYDFPQMMRENSADMELKETARYASKE